MPVSDFSNNNESSLMIPMLGKRRFATMSQLFNNYGRVSLFSLTLLAPIDRVKLLLQNQRALVQQGHLETTYSGVYDCCFKIWKTEGVLAFWKGNMVSYLKFLPAQFLSFNSYFIIKLRLFPKDYGEMYEAPLAAYAKQFAAGGTAGVTTLFAFYPLDYARTRLANDIISTTTTGSERQFKGLIDVYGKTYNMDGVRGFYRGFPSAAVGMFVYRGIYIPLSDYTNPILLTHKTSPLNTMLYIWFLSSMANLLAYPFDTIRTRMMMTSTRPTKFTTAFHCGIYIVKNEGITSLMNGASVSLIRGLAATFVIFGYRLLSKHFKWGAPTTERPRRRHRKADD